MNYEDKLKKFALYIAMSKKIVFFGGAGVSTESGIPDFRSASGLYSEEYENEPPEYIISRSYFYDYPEKFYKFYRTKMIYKDAKPNNAHFFLARLEQIGKLSALITQNIDCLHEDAGSKNITKLHGTVRDNYCVRCKKYYPLEYLLKNNGVPRCGVCGGIVKPDVVLYEEQMERTVVNSAIRAIQDADMLITGGTSLAVYPAAFYVEYFRGDRSVIVNMSRTRQDDGFSLCIREKPIGEVFNDLAELTLI